jgi:hypothetical protein
MLFSTSAAAAVLLPLCGPCSGAADTEEEAHARADALVHAGVVLRFNGIVYLKPQEVSELVYRVSGSSNNSSIWCSRCSRKQTLTAADVHATGVQGGQQQR